MTFLFFVYILAFLFSCFVAGVLLGVAFSDSFRRKVVALVREYRERLRFFKVPHNPIIRPGTHPWTAEAVLNPAAALINGRTHLVYRAIGMDGVSRLGYASSPDGHLFDEHLPYPIYVAQNMRNLPGHARRYSPVMYPSGGSWGGCEDPRMTVIDGRVYVTYNAFDGWDFIRVAVISMPEQDFLAKRFYKWTEPNLLSPPGQRHKNWSVFPEKVHGKFAVLHSIAPKIEVAYVDSLDAVGKTAPFIDSWAGARVDLPERIGVWDSFMRSAGPPPIKTDRGWLVLYHALNKHEMSRYKVGAMLLDLDDPTKEIARASAPILEPDEVYENAGKPGIVYSGGAVVRDGTLFVYYGGADKVVCVATAPLQAFLDDLIAGDPVRLSPAPLLTT